MDREVQDEILRRLETYGDSLLEDNSKKKKRRKVTSLADSETTEVDCKSSIAFQPEHGNLSRSKKRRLKKKLKKLATDNALVLDGSVSEGKSNEKHKVVKEEKLSDNDEDTTDKSSAGKNRQLQMLSDELGLETLKQEIKSEQLEKDRATTLKGKEPTVVVFQSHKKKKKETSQMTTESNENPNVRKRNSLVEDDTEFNMKKARLEVHKFGIKGFHGNEKEEAMTALLIKLGAKPPKNKYVNYKDLLQQRKEAQVQEKLANEKDGKQRPNVKSSKSKDKRGGRDRRTVGELDGQVGRWKAGVQFVKKTDLKGLKLGKLKS